jgi:hypothetical protein
VSKAWGSGSTRRWRTIRAAVLEENLATNGGRCRLQIPTVCTTRANCAHHLLGRAITGDDPRYIVAACTDCNLHIGDPQTHNPACPLCARRPANTLDPEPRPATRW